MATEKQRKLAADETRTTRRLLAGDALSGRIMVHIHRNLTPRAVPTTRGRKATPHFKLPLPSLSLYLASIRSPSSTRPILSRDECIARDEGGLRVLGIRTLDRGARIPSLSSSEVPFGLHMLASSRTGNPRRDVGRRRGCDVSPITDQQIALDHAGLDILHDMRLSSCRRTCTLRLSS